MNVLHITPHLGGGVGKAHATLAEEALSDRAAPGVQPRHVYALLETPRDVTYTDRVRAAGCTIHVAPGRDQLAALAAEADIVQLEWWNHPRLYNFLVTNSLPEIRLTAWIHISGLAPPLVPSGLVEIADQTLFTSSCSLAASNLRSAILDRPEAFGVVNSGFGLIGIPCPARTTDGPLRFGYMGTLDFIKMHPDFFDFIDAVDADVCVHLWGHCEPDGEVARRAAAMRHPSRVRFEGYATDPAGVLSALDVFVYLLAPDHYGTAENALVEAMSVGVVPIVWNNPAETCLVKDGKTGFVVKSQDEFVACVSSLMREPGRLAPLWAAARADVAQHCSPRASLFALETAYAEVRRVPKRRRDFACALGSDARTWFLSSVLGSKDTVRAGNRLFADTASKGSLGHFRTCCPGDDSLLFVDEPSVTGASGALQSD